MDVPPIVRARILNEHAYRSRLAYLEWVDQRFEGSGDTAAGKIRNSRTASDSESSDRTSGSQTGHLTLRRAATPRN